MAFASSAAVKRKEEEDWADEPTSARASSDFRAGSFLRWPSVLEATAASHQAELEGERAERLMSELLRAKADALASRATVTRLSKASWRRYGPVRGGVG